MNSVHKRGEGYVFPCVMIVILCMLLSVLVYFVTTVSMIRTTKENAASVFDTYITENAITIYHSVKQGNDYTEALDTEVYVEALCRYCDLSRDGSMLYRYMEDGSLQYSLTPPIISFVEDNTLKIRVRYTMYLPIRFNGIQVHTAAVPVEIQSSFMEKY